MENGKRLIGKEMAKRLGKALTDPDTIILLATTLKEERAARQAASHQPLEAERT